MAQSCLKCLKYTMCVSNFLCFICGVAVLGFGVHLTINMRLTSLTPSMANFNIGNILLISGIVITCMSFLGFLGALKENRCLLLTFFLVLFLLMLVELAGACFMLMYEGEVPGELNEGLKKEKEKRGNGTRSSDWDVVQEYLKCCGVNNYTDWGSDVPESCCENKCVVPNSYWNQGCLNRLTYLFEENYLTAGISVIALCIIEVLGMCFAMTLFCHISRSGLGYKI